MGLREQAESDLSGILENTEDFGWGVTLISPAGEVQQLTGSTTDIAFLIDPDTGQAISGRQASVTLRRSSLNQDPIGVSDSSIKPWRVTFDSINGEEYTFKIVKSHPDRTLGIISCILEAYK